MASNGDRHADGDNQCAHEDGHDFVDLLFASPFDIAECRYCGERTHD